MLIKTVELSSITPYANNPRKNDKAVDVVANSITQFGFQQPIVVDKDNVIVVGHTRYKAAKKLQLKTVPITVADTLTPEQINAYRLMDNRSNENAKWDDDLLFTELQALLKDDDIVALSFETGFTESELNKLFNESEKDLSKFLNPDAPRSKTGDLWTLGEHKILNGSSTETTSLKLLLGEIDPDQINMVWEDPPYGVSYESAGGINRTKAEQEARTHKIANDALKPEQLDQFLLEHIRTITPFVKPGAAIYWCHDIRFNEQFKKILQSNKYHISDTLIWKKNSTSNWMADYAKFYEPILYGWKEGAPRNWYGKGMDPNAFTMDDLKGKNTDELIDIIMSFATNYQEIAKEPRNIASLHPTVKPVKLVMYHLINSSKKDDIVFDGFCGSGSTLIACEKVSRKARCIELEPKFVDVTIARWQELTGLQAVNQHGVKWDDITAPINTNEAMEAFFNLPTEVVTYE